MSNPNSTYKLVDRKIREHNGIYYVNVGRFAVKSFPTLKDAVCYRDTVEAELLHKKITEQTTSIRKEEDALLASIDGYPENLVKAINASVVVGQEELTAAIESLPNRERECVLCYYELGDSFAKLGKRMFITRVRACQIVSDAVAKLKIHIEAEARKRKEAEEKAERQERFQKDFESLEKHRAALVEQFIKTGVYTEDMVVEFGPVTSKLRSELDVESAEENNAPIEDLELTVRSYNCLHRFGIVRIQQLLDMTVEQIRSLKNLGSKCLMEIRDKLAENGLCLKGDEEWLADFRA